MDKLLSISWNIDPELFRIGGLSLRYYSLLFVLAFMSGYWLLASFFKRENVPQESLNALFLYVFLGTLIGARLGHTLFYEFGYYKEHLLEIIAPFRSHENGRFEWTGYQGLASHGGAVGILIAVALYSKNHQRSFFWVTDRLVIAIALAGFFIRLGNLFNSEIVGSPSRVPWAFVFERVDSIPRHPSQLYEAVLYLFIFFFLGWVYKRKAGRWLNGYLLGLFLILVFSVRFLIEFVKENQVEFENAWPINVGQFLSIPFIGFGLYLIILIIVKSSRNGSKSSFTFKGLFFNNRA